jgi:cytochrome P450
MGVLVVVGDPAEIKRVFTADAEQLRAGEANSLMEPVAGPESILLLDGRRHLSRRKMMLPPFHGERMNVYRELIDEIASEEVDRWPIGEPFSAHASMQTITLRVILRAVLGIEDGARRAQLEQLLPKLLNSAALVWPLLRRDLGPGSPWRRFTALREQVDSILFGEIASRHAESDLSGHEDILSMLVAARDQDGQPMSDEELRDQLVTLLLAGHETTAAALAWIFERVLRTPSVHQRLRAAAAEQDEQYLDCLIKEGLRIRPVVPMAIRRVSATFPLGVHTVPPGALLGCSMLLLHSNPGLYPQPASFRPERFMEGAPDTYTWIPFGGGIRRCIGAAFATLEMKAILRNVFSSCELRPPSAQPERPRRRFVTYPPNRGARVVLVGRSRR